MALHTDKQPQPRIQVDCRCPGSHPAEDLQGTKCFKNNIKKTNGFPSSFFFFFFEYFFVFSYLFFTYFYIFSFSIFLIYFLFFLFIYLFFPFFLSFLLFFFFSSLFFFSLYGGHTQASHLHTTQHTAFRGSACTATHWNC